MQTMRRNFRTIRAKEASRLTTSTGSSLYRLSGLWMLLFLVTLVGALSLGCQRQMPSELPYDPETAESLRQDLNEFSESG